MIGLLRLLRDHADAVESDLSTYNGIRYTDRWRRDPDGARRLTLREILVRAKRWPADSATAIETGGTGWRLEHHLLADLFHATTGDPHPGLPEPDAVAKDTQREKAKAAALERKRAREAAIAAGEIT